MAANHLALFLKDGPAIHKGISTIHLSYGIPRTKKRKFYFRRQCEYLAQNLELESVYIAMDACETDLQNLLDGKKHGLEDLTAATNLKVRSGFGIRITRYYCQTDHDTGSDGGTDFISLPCLRFCF